MRGLVPGVCVRKGGPVAVMLGQDPRQTHHYDVRDVNTALGRAEMPHSSSSTSGNNLAGRKGTQGLESLTGNCARSHT